MLGVLKPEDLGSLVEEDPRVARGPEIGNLLWRSKKKRRRFLRGKSDATETNAYGEQPQPSSAEHFDSPLL